MFTVLMLGGAQVEGPSGPFTGRAGHRRRIALLVLLANSRAGSLTRDKIVGYLWPDNDSARARHLLSISLHYLRRGLGDDAFISIGDELSLNPEVVSSDVARFDAAIRAGDTRRAVELYRGPFLDGFYVTNAPAFEQWVDTERYRLERAYAEALEDVAAAAEASGDMEEATRWWQLLTVHDPFSSRAALRLMRALDATGDRISAIRHAGTHAAVLREQLDMEPDADVAALAMQLRASTSSTNAEVPMASTSVDPNQPVRVFVVHGHDAHAREATARVIERLGFEAVVLHEQPNRGKTILEKFLAIGGVQFAVILLTPDDRGGMTSQPDSGLRARARQNVVFEFGFFVGRLGRERVCALYQGNVELPSDLHGLLYISMDHGEGWKYELAREMRAAGLPVDLNRLMER